MTWHLAPCAQAAAELRDVVGPLGALAPNTAALLAKMDACVLTECEGSPRHRVVRMAFESVRDDHVLALLN